MFDYDDDEVELVPGGMAVSGEDWAEYCQAIDARVRDDVDDSRHHDRRVRRILRRLLREYGRHPVLLEFLGDALPPWLAIPVYREAILLAPAWGCSPIPATVELVWTIVASWTMYDTVPPSQRPPALVAEARELARQCLRAVRAKEYGGAIVEDSDDEMIFQLEYSLDELNVSDHHFFHRWSQCRSGAGERARRRSDDETDTA